MVSVAHLKYFFQKIIKKRKPQPVFTTDAVSLLPNEAISRFLLCKDLLTLDLKYYEKNSMQI